VKDESGRLKRYEFEVEPYFFLYLPDPSLHTEMLEALVTAGEYPSVSEAIRDAIRHLLESKKGILEKSQSLGSFT
jgi:hypothetical protein